MKTLPDSREITGEPNQIKQDILGAIQVKDKNALINAVASAVLHIKGEETLLDTEEKLIVKLAADFLGRITQDVGDAMCRFNLFDRCFAYLQFDYSHKTKAVSFSLTGLKIFPEMRERFDEIFS